MSTEHAGADPMLGTPQTTDERSLGDIVGDVAQDLSNLVKQELELATAEMKQEATRAGKGAGLLGGASVAGLLFLVFLSLTLTFLLDNWMPLELAAVIVTVVWAGVAAILAARGRSELKRTNPQLPKTQQTLKEDAAWARAQKS
ncbi:phage holin family protein [Nocardioides sp. SR21]|uniref:phage holin family protein n=1 Tax=Nocardioides sp. SR21 TaxID=2919501 RepID=UPI001FA9E86E|nr:phage holin family protein [Nocardioides sp. SR21]